MRIVKTVPALRRAVADLRKKGRKIGFVPTMGYLHEGHVSLLRASQKECGTSILSIYVNPTQFGPKEDLAKYPRDLRRDLALARKENVDIVFVPSDNVVYPNGFLTNVDVGELTEGLCGAFRPGHFKGVATVVAKLINMVGPDVMYLGRKDAQQVAVLKAMVRDLDLDCRIRVVDTVREADGLAKSSRNVYLSPDHRQQAPILYRALSEAAASIKKGERSATTVIASIKKAIGSTDGHIQYVACVDATTLKPLARLQGEVLIALAVFFGKTRLIDNITVKINGSNSKKS